MTRPEIPYVGWESVQRPEVRHEPAPSYDACPDAIVEEFPGHGRHEWEKDGRTVKCRGYRLPPRGAVWSVGLPDPDPEYTDNVVAGKHYPGNRSPGAGYRE